MNTTSYQNAALLHVDFTCRIADCAGLRMDLLGSYWAYETTYIRAFVLDGKYEDYAPDSWFVFTWNGPTPSPPYSHTVWITLNFSVEGTGWKETVHLLVRSGSSASWGVSVR